MNRGFEGPARSGTPSTGPSCNAQVNLSRPITLSRRTPSAAAEGATAAGQGAGGRAPADISAVAWIPRDELGHRQWVDAGRKLGAIGRSSQWWIGDWIRYGTAKWGERYSAAARVTGYDAASLRNMAWVSSQFDLSLRSDKLTWSHHVLLAPLEEEEKREWLDRAAREKLSVSDLRTELRASTSGEAGPATEPDSSAGDRLTVACPNCGHQLELPVEWLRSPPPPGTPPPTPLVSRTAAGGSP